jgi:Trk-type K+ transport system membrane component
MLDEQLQSSNILRAAGIMLDYHLAHALALTGLSLVASLVLLALEDGAVAWVDCWFTATSAVTVTGLGVVDTAALRTSSKAVVLSLICLGGQVSFAVVPLCIRRVVAWRQRLKGSVDAPAREAREARALRVLMALYLAYGAAWTALGWLALSVHCASDARAREVLAERGLSPIWFGLFTAVSAFNNAGFSLVDSLVPFQDDAVMLLIVAALIAAGNTLLPVLCRAALSLAQRTLLRGDEQDAVELLLSRPRLFTTHMFEGGQTLWLLLIWLATTGFQFLVYTFAPYNVPLQSLSWSKALQMFFTTISTRTAGFNVIDLDTLCAGVLVMQLMLMYLASYPFIVAVKSTREGALEQEQEQEQEQDARRMEQQLQDQQGQQEQRQPRQCSSRREQERFSGPIREARKTLASDLWWLAISAFLVAVTNTWLDIATLFRLNWEVVSAFGTVGTSLPLPGHVASFSSGLNDFGKLVIIAVMIAGRHRGMPHSLDAAITPIGLHTEREIAQRVARLTRRRTSRVLDATERTYRRPLPQPRRTQLSKLFPQIDPTLEPAAAPLERV